ncbi:OmpA family protein [Vibrio sp. ArtGut-C1]|uniref:OmpA family protein n=1 Tax=Vibrio sp. ArtGut-C1 TaxID=2259137 RepID=UPI000A199BF4|nr:OmpA family protein [Vibrio sp. ArtGut-C1]
MNSKIKFIKLLISISLIGCASSEELYANYDALCAKPAPPKIVAIGTKTVPWQPAIYFGFDGEELHPEQIRRLENNLNMLKKNPTLKVSIRAFTDQLGSDSYNKKLSQRRLDTVFNYLKNRGIDSFRIKESSVGKQVFILNDESEQSRIINRRVEMLLLNNDGRPLVQFIDVAPALKDEFIPPEPVR